MTLRQARRKLGSRTNRRANTNGKVLRGGNYSRGKKNISPKRKNPVPVVDLGPKVRAILAKANG